VTVELWDGEGPVLVDTSAWVIARRDPRARKLLLPAVARGDVAWCWPVRYELIVDARGPEGIAAVDRTLEGLREIAVDRAVQRGVLSVMRELADEGSHGAHRLPLTDLTVAVAAQRSGLDVVHYDRHFERLGELLRVRMLWIAECPPEALEEGAPSVA
jgi:predicted nucleic acid-binding protein